LLLVLEGGFVFIDGMELPQKFDTPESSGHALLVRGSADFAAEPGIVLQEGSAKSGAQPANGGGFCERVSEQV
jgi:hypothetical protein